MSRPAPRCSLRRQWSHSGGCTVNGSKAMYQRFYGLRKLPSELTPNPKFLFLTAGHREALSNLHYGVTSGKPLTVLLGEAGTGKTTVLRTAFESEQCRHVRWVYLNNPILTREDFVKTLA